MVQQGASETASAKVAEPTEFEEVPVAESDAESAGSSDTEMEEPDEQTAAELRAMAKVMLNGRSRQDVLDGAYHRYAFHDDRLPRWFAEDEQRHMRRAFNHSLSDYSKTQVVQCMSMSSASRNGLHYIGMNVIDSLAFSVLDPFTWTKCIEMRKSLACPQDSTCMVRMQRHTASK